MKKIFKLIVSSKWEFFLTICTIGIFLYTRHFNTTEVIAFWAILSSVIVFYVIVITRLIKVFRKFSNSNNEIVKKELREKVEKLTQDNLSLKQKLVDNDLVIAELEKENTKIKTDSSNLTTEINAKHHELNQYNIKFSEREAQITNLERELHILKNKIDSLEASLFDHEKKLGALGSVFRVLNNMSNKKLQIVKQYCYLFDLYHYIRDSSGRMPYNIQILFKSGPDYVTLSKIPQARIPLSEYSEIHKDIIRICKQSNISQEEVDFFYHDYYIDLAAEV